ncbi:MAG TPA: exostosin family protein [Blastocatellia bacterium]|nr:exostosin family protein [Blastocatellia bacterium]
MRLRVLFTQTDHEDQVWGSEGFDWAIQMRDQILQSTDTPHEITDRPEKADIIVFWEPHQDSQVTWAPRLRSHPLIHEFPNKAFVVSVEDKPLGFLPGLYTSLPARWHHPKRHRTWIFYRTQNPYTQSRRTNRRVDSPANLASFSGANSHALRARLFDMNESLAREDILLVATPRNRFSANPNDPQLKESQLNFIDAILGAKFSLCPRGNGVATYRVQESLALGRAPVIISDEWIPVSGLDWRRFAIFIGEKDVSNLPAILREHEPRWKEMGERAQEAYDSFFRRETFAANALHHIDAIYRNRTHDERQFISQWDQIIAVAKRRAVR